MDDDATCGRLGVRLALRLIRIARLHDRLIKAFSYAFLKPPNPIAHRTQITSVVFNRLDVPSDNRGLNGPMLIRLLLKTGFNEPVPDRISTQLEQTHERQ